MRNHDFVSDGFLALTAGGLFLLCSSLVALAFAWAPPPVSFFLTTTTPRCSIQRCPVLPCSRLV